MNSLFSFKGLKKNDINDDSKPTQKESGPGITKASKLLMPSIVKSPGKRRQSSIKIQSNLVSLGGPSGATQSPTPNKRARLSKNQRRQHLASLGAPSSADQFLKICTPKNQPHQKLASNDKNTDAGQILDSPAAKKRGRAFRNKALQKCELHGPDCASPDLKKDNSLLSGVNFTNSF